MTPITFVMWLQAITEVGATMERLFALGKQMNAGTLVTEEQLAAAKAGTDVAVNEWDAAAIYDKEDTDGR